MSPTPRLALAIAGLAVLTLALPLAVTALLAVALVAAACVDAAVARRPPQSRRAVPAMVARGVPAELQAEATAASGCRARIRQAAPPDLALEPREADGELAATLIGLRRGRHTLPALAARTVGPLGLGCSYRQLGSPVEVAVYPDLPAARKLALAVRQGRFSDQGRTRRGPLGLGTEFESVREYLPDDDVRQLNWAASARAGRPMSNQYRVEQDRDVIVLLDSGRLMAAPLGDRTRLDAAADAATAIAMVADELGDRAGTVAFDREIRRYVRPRRRGGRDVVGAIFDLEPSAFDSDHMLALTRVEGGKRALVFVLTDVLDEAAARALLESVAALARRHALVVASAVDPDMDAAVRTEPRAALDVLRASVAVEALRARARVAARLRQAGATVIEAPAERLGAACVGAYLRQKARARF